MGGAALGALVIARGAAGRESEKMAQKKRSAQVSKKSPDVVVVGAGAFGGWTALYLAEQGARVTLLDAWGAGHLRGTSSGESRVIRAGYGEKEVYTRWAWRALEIWRRREKEWASPLFVPSGVLWMCDAEDDYVRASRAALERQGIPVEHVAHEELRRRFPQIGFEGIRFGYLEPRAGFLRARLATEAVAKAVAKAGGDVRIGAVEPPAAAGPKLERLRLTGGEEIAAGHFVFACGPWLPKLFPRQLAQRIRVTKQEVFFFGPPAGDRRFEASSMPVWIEISSGFYGIPASDGRGFKVADDRSGPEFDPTAGDRVVSTEGLESARRFLGRRFPGMAGAALVETRVCQYERTPDAHLVMDRHPEYENVWIVGGGSGHGFKLGPAVGEVVSRHVLGLDAEAIPAEMRLGAIAYPESGEGASLRGDWSRSQSSF